MSASRRIVLAAALAGCASFEDPTIVLDLRVIGMTATPPEQVLDVDLANPQLADVVAQLQPSFVCATVADPGRARALHWTMTACLADDNARCDATKPQLALGSGELTDPEVAPQPVCVIVAPDPGLVAILTQAIQDDPVHGLGGLDYGVELAVRGDDDAADQFALKQLRISARLPAERTPNHNPTLRQLRSRVGGRDAALVLEPCATQLDPIVAGPNQLVALQPQELDDSRETYFTPTIEGTFEMFTETLRYQWLATGGSFSDETTGGPTDFAGNTPELGNEWHAPAVDHATDVELWLVQRDERLGASVYPTCVHVTP